MGPFSGIVITCFIFGIYFVLSKGSLKRTMRVLRFVAKDWSKEEFDKLNHSLISTIWGIYGIVTAGWALLAGFAAERHMFGLIWLVWILWIVSVFSGSVYITKYILTGKHFKPKD